MSLQVMQYQDQVNLLRIHRLNNLHSIIHKILPHQVVSMFPPQIHHINTTKFTQTPIQIICQIHKVQSLVAVRHQTLTTIIHIKIRIPQTLRLLLHFLKAIQITLHPRLIRITVHQELNKHHIPLTRHPISLKLMDKRYQPLKHLRLQQALLPTLDPSLISVSGITIIKLEHI